MASSGNFGTWNPLNIGSGGATSLTVGNTNAVMTGADPRTTGTVGGVISDTDGYYFETVATSIGDGALTLGIVNEDRNNQCMGGQIHSRSGSFMWRSYDSGAFFVETSSNTSYGTFANGDILGWYVKNSKLYVKKNNSNVVGDVANVSAGIDISGGFFFPAVSRTVGGGSQTTAILRTDSDDWSYSPPAGFKGLTSKDMLVDSNIDPAGDDGADDNPTKNFNVVTFTGNSSTNVITGLGFKPDLIWGFTRDGAQDKRFIDSTRGGSSKITSNTTNNAATSNVVISEFGTDGFTANGGQFNNDNSKACGAWCWKANGGTTASNSNGTITSTVQANTKAGFSIVKFTGNGSNNATVGHGLDSAPDFIICKPYESGSLSWHVFSRAMGTGEFILNNNSAFSTRTTSFTESGTTATNFTLGSDAGNMNYSGVDTMAYCWHNVEGMQKFSIYTGNADADGPFVYTGFRPRLVAIKKASGSNDWVVTDTARNTVNPASKVVRWDSDAVESSSNREIDLLSNGFKPRTTNDVYNGSGGTYFYMAWGDVPFKYNNTF